MKQIRITSGLLLVLALSGRASPQPHLRIGIFWLFNITTLQVRTIEEPLGLQSSGAQTFPELGKGSSLVVASPADRLSCQTVDSSGRVIEAWGCENLAIGAPGKQSLVQLTIPGKLTRLFRGRILLSIPILESDSPPTRMRVTLETQVEDAVAAVAAAESPATPGKAALDAMKVHAVIARSYIASHPNRHRPEGFDLCDSTHCQLYRGEDLTNERAGQLGVQAARETRGLVLAYEGKPIEAYFTGLCGGLTTTPHVAWGSEQAGHYRYQPVRCRWCQTSPRYRWARRVSAGKLLAALQPVVSFTLTSQAEITAEREENGFVSSVTVRDGVNRVRLSVSQFRHTLGRTQGWNTVISNRFTLERRGGEYLIRGAGFGHNVGLCTTGAIQQAQVGRDWETILRFYYPGTTLVRSTDAARE